jgi:ABC-type branched-subunit amino acid transport system permease subunit
MVERTTREKSEIEKLMDKDWKGFLLILLIGAAVSALGGLIFGHPITWQRIVKDAFGLLSAFLVLAVVETGLRLHRQWSEFFDDWKKRRSSEL